MDSRILRSMYPSAHPDYTSLYDGIQLAVSGTFQANYGNIVVLEGGATIKAPSSIGSGPAFVKECRHFAVVNPFGVGGATIDGNGFDINGSSSPLAVPAFAGANVQLWWSVALGGWVAFVGGAASGFTPPPSYKGLGPNVDQTFTNAAPTAVNNASITTAPFPIGSFAMIAYTCELQSSTVGAAAQANFGIFDGTASVVVDGALRQTIGVPSGGETTVFEVVTVVTRVAGTGLARTFGLSIVANDAQNILVRAGSCRGTVLISAG